MPLHLLHQAPKSSTKIVVHTIYKMTPHTPNTPSSDGESPRNTLADSTTIDRDDSIPRSYANAARGPNPCGDTPAPMTTVYPAASQVTRALGTSLAPRARSFGYSRSQSWVTPRVAHTPRQPSSIPAEIELHPSSPHQRPTHRPSTGVAHTDEQQDVPRLNMGDSPWYGQHPPDQYTGAQDIGLPAYHMGLAGFRHPTTRIDQANSIVAHRPLYSRNDTHNQIVASLHTVHIPANSLPTVALTNNDACEDSPTVVATLARRQEAMASDCLVCAQEHKSVWFETGCGHIACAECMVRWLKEHQTCPSCRRVVVGEEVKLIVVDNRSTDDKDETGS